MKKILVLSLCALSMSIFTAFTSTTPEVNTTISTTTTAEMSAAGMISWSVSGGSAIVIIDGIPGGSSGSTWVWDANNFSIDVMPSPGYVLLSVSYDHRGNGVHVSVVVAHV